MAPAKVTELGPERVVSLYRGQAEYEQWAVAPYLTKVDEELFDWIVNSLRGKPWGIFAVADVNLASLRKHLRRFLIVEAPDGNPMYFRYYDPRVIANFLPTCTNEELTRFFGSIKAFGIIDPQEERLTFFLHV
jgi:hypothetical protein